MPESDTLTPTWDQSEPIPSWEDSTPIEESDTRAPERLPAQEPVLQMSPLAEPARSSEDLMARNAAAIGAIQEAIPGYKPYKGVEDIPALPPELVRQGIELGTAGIPIPESLRPFAEGLKRATAEQVAGMTTPSSLATMPAFAIPYVGPALAMGLGAKGVGAGAGKLTAALEQGDTQQAGEATSELLGAGAMLAAPLGHGGIFPSRVPPVIEPRPMAPESVPLPPQRPVVPQLVQEAIRAARDRAEKPPEIVTGEETPVVTALEPQSGTPIQPQIRAAIEQGAEMGLDKSAAALAKIASEPVESIEFEPLDAQSGASLKPQPTEVSSASTKPSAESVSQPEIRTRVGKTTPLRQPGETAGAQTEPRNERVQAPAEAQAAPEISDLSAVKTTEQAWDYGRARNTPEGIAELEKAQTDMQARLDAIKADPNLPPMEKLNQRAALATESQLIREALSAAKGETDRPAMTAHFEKKAAEAAPAATPTAPELPKPAAESVSPAKPVTPAAQHKAAAKTFTDRLKEYGEQLGFILRPDDVHGWVGGKGEKHSGASVAAKMAHDKEMAAAKRRAIVELGGDPEKPNFAALSTELEKRIAQYEDAEAGFTAERPGDKPAEFVPPEPETVSLKPESVSETPKSVSEPTIFGYSWDQIKSAQQGVKLSRTIKGSATRPKATEADYAALDKYGVEGLQKRESYGVLDRLGLPVKPETPATVPKLGAGEKGTGDLLKNVEEPLKLVGEKAVDTERLAAEKAAAEKAKAEAAALQAKQQPGLSLDVESVARQPRGIASSVRRKWATATDQPLGGEGGFITLGPIEDFLESVTKGIKGVGEGVKNAFDATKAAYKENFNLQKTSDYRRSILNWSAKQQRSFSEAAQAQAELSRIFKDPIRDAAATNWMQAGGDPAVLRQWLAATKAWRDPVTGKPHPEAKRLIKEYEAALTLTPEEIAAAQDARNAYDALGQRGDTYDVLKTFKPNYVTQVWDLKQGPTGGNKGMGFGARTLKERFRFAKASTFPTYFAGEQVGFVPKTKQISRLLPMYLHEMNNVIAARQLVEQLSRGKASDGLPLLRPKGSAVVVETPAAPSLPGMPPGTPSKAVLVMPDALKGDQSVRYVGIENQPALHDWTWQTKDSAGNPIFMKSDLEVHPEVAGKFKDVLGSSAIREWYQSKTSASAEIPKAIVKAIDNFQSETKKTMLGLLAPFHQVQEGTHAVGHRVNPFFNNPKIDLVNNAAQMDAARHGVMLAPDRVSAQQFMEGFKQSGLVSKIPGLGKLADHYAHYLFHDYIPGLKFKTYEAIRDRNMKVFEKDLASGKVSPEDVKILSAEQANAAYGHLNYADLGRNPTVQHFWRLALLAPDFLEARGRFAAQSIKGVTGAKVGREQLVALSTLAVAQAALSYIMAKATGGEWEEKDPFSFHIGNRKYLMRSVPEDLYRFATDTRAFVYARLNPTLGRGAAQYTTGVDWRGRKVTAAQTTKELLQQPVPLTLRPLLGIGNTSLSGWEELAGAAGVKVSRYSNVAEVSKMAHKWMDKSTDPRIKAAEEQHKQETLPDSAYKPLREALMKDDFKLAEDELKKLMEIRKISEIQKAMHSQRPFTGSQAVEIKFRNSLTPEEGLRYDAARKEQRDLYQKYLKLRRGTNAPPIAP